VDSIVLKRRNASLINFNDSIRVELDNDGETFGIESVAVERLFLCSREVDGRFASPFMKPAN
jgi:hypothetical protein